MDSLSYLLNIGECALPLRLSLASEPCHLRWLLGAGKLPFKLSGQCLTCHHATCASHALHASLVVKLRSHLFRSFLALLGAEPGAPSAWEWVHAHNRCCRAIASSACYQEALCSDPDLQGPLLDAMTRHLQILANGMPHFGRQFPFMLPALWNELSSTAAVLLEASWVPAAVQHACWQGGDAAGLLEALLQTCLVPVPTAGASAAMRAAVTAAECKARQQSRRAAVMVAEAALAAGTSYSSELTSSPTSSGSPVSSGSRSRSSSTASVDSPVSSSSADISLCGSSSADEECGSTRYASKMQQLALVSVRHLPQAVAATQQLLAAQLPNADPSASQAAGAPPTAEISGASQPPPAAASAGQAANEAAMAGPVDIQSQASLMRSLLNLAAGAPAPDWDQLHIFAEAALAALQLLPLVPRLQQDMKDAAADVATALVMKLQYCTTSASLQSVSPAVSEQLWHVHQWAARLVHASCDAAQPSGPPDVQRPLLLLIVCYSTASDAFDSTACSPQGSAAWIGRDR